MQSDKESYTGLDLKVEKDAIESTEVGLLLRAFESFEEASSKLQTRYECLSKEAERLRSKLHQKEIEVRRAERMSVLGETAAALAHEVRNPLGAIKLFTSLLKEDLEEMPSSLELVEEIDRSVTGLDMLVSNILQFSKDSKGDFSPVNLNAVIEEQLRYFKKIVLQKEISLRFESCENSYILGNSDSIRQLLHNILQNSIQALKAEGDIFLSTSSEEFFNKKWLVLNIKDNGPGIPQNLLDNLFDPFITGRNEGTGLGLAIVKKIVEQHHGGITAYNQNGAVFVIKFPLTENV